MKMRLASVALTIGLVLLAPIAEAAVHEVRTVRTGDAARPHAFEPANLTIAVGDTVRWVNGDGVYHTVKSSSSTTSNVPSDLFGAPVASEGAEYSFTFNDTGEHRYFCQPHAGFMWGMVTVADAAGPSPTPGGEGASPTPGLAGVGVLAVLCVMALARRRR